MAIYRGLMDMHSPSPTFSGALKTTFSAGSTGDSDAKKRGSTAFFQCMVTRHFCEKTGGFSLDVLSTNGLICWIKLANDLIESDESDICEHPLDSSPCQKVRQTIFPRLWDARLLVCIPIWFDLVCWLSVGLEQWQQLICARTYMIWWVLICWALQVMSGATNKKHEKNHTEWSLDSKIDPKLMVGMSLSNPYGQNVSGRFWPNEQCQQEANQQNEPWFCWYCFISSYKNPSNGLFKKSLKRRMGTL